MKKKYLNLILAVSCIASSCILASCSCKAEFPKDPDVPTEPDKPVEPDPDKPNPDVPVDPDKPVDPEPEKKTYKITYISNGGSEVESAVYEENSEIIKPVNPTKEGIYFAGWFEDEALTKRFNFENATATKDLTLYAKWLKESKPSLEVDVKENYEIRVGDVLNLPKATSFDEIQENMNDEIRVYTTSEWQFGHVNEDLTFEATCGGEYKVIYSVENFLGFKTEKYTTIKVDTLTEENFQVTNHNDLTLLKDAKVRFKENFETGGDCPLVDNSLWTEATIIGDERAIAGNSLFVDYVKLKGMHNKVNFYNLLPYLDVERGWHIEFDVKLARGKGFNDFFIGYGDRHSIISHDQQFPLDDMKVGDIKHITYNVNFVPPELESYFYFFKLEQNRNYDCELAFDNFVIYHD